MKSKSVHLTDKTAMFIEVGKAKTTVKVDTGIIVYGDDNMDVILEGEDNLHIIFTLTDEMLSVIKKVKRW